MSKNRIVIKRLLIVVVPAEAQSDALLIIIIAAALVVCAIIAGIIMVYKQLKHNEKVSKVQDIKELNRVAPRDTNEKVHAAMIPSPTSKMNRDDGGDSPANQIIQSHQAAMTDDQRRLINDAMTQFAMM